MICEECKKKKTGRFYLRTSDKKTVCNDCFWNKIIKDVELELETQASSGDSVA